jgi:hypothetical protein
VARRLIADDTFETWVVVGDRVIAAMLMPTDLERSGSMIAILNEPGVTVLAIEPAERGPTFPDESQAVVPQPGDRVVAFGPKQVFESVRRNAS